MPKQPFMKNTGMGKQVSHSPEDFRKRIQSQKMKRSFGDMDLLQQSNNVEKLLRGMIRQPVEKADSNFVDDVSMIKDLLGNGL